MCGRFEQSGTRRYYAQALGVNTEGSKWVGGDSVPQYNLSPGRPLFMFDLLSGKIDCDHVIWGYRTPEEAAAKKKPWINARVEKVLTGRYFGHMFREGRVLIPAGGWYEWPVENGKKQLWYITRKIDAPIFMAGLANFRPYTQQAVEVGLSSSPRTAAAAWWISMTAGLLCWNRRTPGAGWILLRRLRKLPISRRHDHSRQKCSNGGA